jgi:hypothetical protein
MTDVTQIVTIEWWLALVPIIIASVIQGSFQTYFNYKLMKKVMEVEKRKNPLVEINDAKTT